ncbi:hypothetical protein [Bacillus dakarensis]|uniref:hypothetical protein n=1 Tax=Robertmurraya dakarensis TaxID=1926278 RepID=UPI000982121F|nr:hypothetical protein [Bacillus dakarensis]
MNTKLKKGIFWGVIVASVVLAINVFHSLFGGVTALAAGPQRHGHGPRAMGHHGGLEPNYMTGHYYGGFSWFWFLLLLILGIVALVLFVKWTRRKSKASAMQQFIDTSLASSHRHFSNQNANILDQWEKRLVNKKENI